MRRLLAAFHDLVRRRSAPHQPITRKLRRRRRQYEPELALTRLEERRLLNADFALAADALQLDFTDPLAADTLTVSRDGSDYKFEIGSGVWSGGPVAGVTGAGTNTLLVDTATANALAQGIVVRDDGDLQAELLAADFSGLIAGLEFTNTELVTGDSGPFAVPSLSLITASNSPFSLGPLDVDGDLSITAATTVDDFASTGSLRVTGDLAIAAGVLPGDYDGSLTVDTGDFDVWLANDGMTSSGPPLAGDGNGDGVVDGADFTLWRDSVGRSVDAGTSTIDIGVGLDVEVGGATKLESRGGGDIRVGAIGDAQDSGRTVELDAGFNFQTTGDVQLVEDSNTGVSLLAASSSLDPTIEDNSAGDLTIRTQGNLGIAALTVDSLDVVVRGRIAERTTGEGDRIEVAGDATLVAGFLAADFNADGVVNNADYTVWRDNLGKSNAPGDANNDAVTDAADYLLWQSEFGAASLADGSDIALIISELVVGDLLSIESRGSSIEVGRGVLPVELGRLRFQATGNASFTETSADGIKLDRQASGLAGGAANAQLFALNGGVVLDSVEADMLTVFANGAVTDAAGAQIEAADLFRVDSNDGAILLGDTATDRIEGGEGLFTADQEIVIGQEGAANFTLLDLDGATVSVHEASSTHLRRVTTTGDLSVTAAGDVSRAGGFLQVAGHASFETTQPGASIIIDGAGVQITSASLRTTSTSHAAADGAATLNVAGGLDLAASTVEGDLEVTANGGDLTDSGPIAVLGSARFEVSDADSHLVLDQLAAAGPIALATVAGGAGGGATIVNTAAVEFASTDVAGALQATALTGDITNATGAVTVTGIASFTASAGGITLGRDNSFAAGSLSLAGGAADVVEGDATRLDQVAVDQLALGSGGQISDLAGASIAVAGAASLTAAGDIVLGEQAGDILEVGGLASFTADDLIEIGPAGTANFGALSLSGVTATIQEDSSTVLQTIAVDTLNLTSEGIGDNSNIVIPGNLSLVSAGDIILADNVGDVLTVGGAASFTAGGDIELGLAGAANFGALALDTQTLGAGDASVREMSSTLLTTVDVGNLTLESTGGIADDIAAAIDVAGDAAFMAVGDIVLADGAAGTITVDGRATFDTPSDVLVGQVGVADLGSLVVAADEARVTNASSLRVDGVATRLLQLDATGSITDLSGASIVVAEDAAIVASGSILLGNAPGDVLSVGADATLSAGGVLFVGPSGLANFGRLSLAGTSVEVQEDSSTELFDVTATTLELASAGSITDLVGSTIAVAGSADFNAAGDITLGDQLTESLTVGGLASFDLSGDLTVGAAGEANFGSLLINADNAAVQEDSSTLLRGVTAASLLLEAAGAITDEAVPPTAIVVAGDARFVAAGPITLADTAGDTLGVDGFAEFNSTAGATIDVGFDAAGGPSDAAVGFGTVSFRSQDGATRGTVRISEDDAMNVVGGNTGGDVVLIADDGDMLSNATAASITLAGAITADALRLQSDGSISQEATGALAAPVLQLVAGYDAEAFDTFFLDLAPVRSAAFTPDIRLPLASNAIDQVSIAAANGSVELVGQSSLEIAATTVDGRELSGVTIVDARVSATDAADASLDLTLALSALGGGITQQRVDVLAPTPEPVTIAVDVARATFTVAGGSAIQLLDMEVDESAPGDTLLLNQDAVRSATTNRFFNDNAAVAGVDPSRQETELAFDGLGSAPSDIAIADQTGVQLGFAASDMTFGFDAAGDVIVIAGKSPLSDMAISQEGVATIGGDAQFHAAGGSTATQAGDIDLPALAINGALAATTDGGDATLTSAGDLVFRSDIATRIRRDSPSAGGNLAARAAAGVVTDQPGATIVVESDAQFTADTDITLADAAADVLSVTGLATLTASGDIGVGPAGTVNFGTLSLFGDEAVVQEDSTTVLDTVDTRTLALTSAGDLLDAASASIAVADRGDFVAAQDIFLSDDAGALLEVGGMASFTAGQDITLAAFGVVNVGTLSLDGVNATVSEDSSTTLKVVAVDTLDLTSAGSIDDVAAASIAVADRAALSAQESGDITLADDAGDVLTVGGDAEFFAGDDQIDLGPAGAVNLGTLSLESATANVQEDSTTVLDRVVVDTLDLQTAGDLIDVAAADIRVTGDAVFTADDGITLNTDNLDGLTVGGMATFTAGDDITIGPAGGAAFGSITLAGEAVSLQEDDATVIKGITADSLFLESAFDINDAAGAAILVSGGAEFVAGLDIVLADEAADVLVIGGAASFTTATNINLGPDGLANFGTLSLAGDEATVQEDSTTQLDQVAVRVLTLSSTATISDVDAADITVTELATLTATTPFEDVILGDGSATLRLGGVDVVSAQHVSLQELDGFAIAGVTITGTLFATADTGSIEQLTNTRPIVADAIGLRTPSGGVLLHSVATGRFAAEAGGAIDIAGKSFAADALLAELADERIAEGDDTGLAPTTIDGDSLAALAVDSEFGVTVLFNRGDLVIGRVSDPTTGAAGDADGVRSSGGHAFVETVFSRTDNPGPGDVTFEGVDTADGRAVVMENDHVFTAVASGELVIETAATDLVATGSLGLGTGVVTDVSGYLSYDDRDGFDTGVVIVDAVPKEGVGLVVTIPSTDLNAPTSRLVGAGNIDPETGDPAPNTQFVELVIGRVRETNLGLQIVFADGAVIAEFLPATDVGAGPTPGDVFSHTFAEAFLGDGQTNPAFPDLPTSIVAFSDPRINLYSEGGAQNLNRSVTPTGATLPSGPMAGAPAPERIDQFVLATTQQVFQVAEQPVPPEVTVLFSAPPPVIAPTPSSEVLLQTSVDFRVSVAAEETITIEFGPLNESAMAEGEALIIEGAEEDWEQGADNYLAEIKQEIRDSDRPAGRYVIKAERGGGAAPDLTIYEKPSSIRAEPDGTLLPPGARAPAPASPVADAGGDHTGPVATNPVAANPVAIDPQAAWTAAWIDWAQRDPDPLARPEVGGEGAAGDGADGVAEPSVELLRGSAPVGEADRHTAALDELAADELAVDELMVGAVARLRHAR